MRLIFNFIFGLLIFTSCTLREKNPKEFMNYVDQPTSPFRVEKEMDNIVYSVQYRPIEYMASLEFLKNGKDLKSSLNDFTGLRYFVFTIKSKDKNMDVLKEDIENIQEYYKRIEYFSFLAQNTFSLQCSKGSLEPTLYHYERTYNLVQEHKILLAFTDSNLVSNCDLVFSYDDKVFGSGKINFSFPSNKISNLPKLVLQ